MIVNEKNLIEENIFDLLSNIYLSVKSLNPFISIDDNVIETGNIYIKSSATISYISLKMEKVSSNFFKSYDNYAIDIGGSNKNYSDSFPRMRFESKLLSKRCRKVLHELFNYLSYMEQNRIKKESNDNVINIIKEISGSIDPSLKRDDKINELLK